jgi:hypothetical protein
MLSPVRKHWMQRCFITFVAVTGTIEEISSSAANADGTTGQPCRGFESRCAARRIAQLVEQAVSSLLSPRGITNEHFERHSECQWEYIAKGAASDKCTRLTVIGSPSLPNSHFSCRCGTARKEMANAGGITWSYWFEPRSTLHWSVVKRFRHASSPSTGERTGIFLNNTANADGTTDC